MSLNVKNLRDHLQQFRFQALFVEDLGWNNPASNKLGVLKVGDTESRYRQIATLGGVLVLEIENKEALTQKKLREAFDKEAAKLALEHLLIFTNSFEQPAQTLWYWVKRDGKKRSPRDHLFVKGQTGDLFISKIAGMFVDLSELDEHGNLDIINALRRLEGALDVQTVTKKFYKKFSDVRLEFKDFITGISDEKDQAHYASVLMHRLMFIYFLQKKGFLDARRGNDGDKDYLRNKLEQHRSGNFYDDLLKDLFFVGFAQPDDDPNKRALEGKLGKIKYLNGGLFQTHRIEDENANIAVDNRAFENLFELFGAYTWNLDDRPGGDDDAINPDVLGYIFEKYINQKAYGAYYTRPEITEYLCKQTIEKLILERVNQGRGTPGLPAVKFSDYNEMLVTADAAVVGQMLGDLNHPNGILSSLKLLDPACGSGAFLIAALKTLMDAYGAMLGRIEILNNPTLNAWRDNLKGGRKSPNYVVKRRIVTDNLFGVDLMPEATDIARLRLFLAMVSSANSVDELEPLPNIDFNILSGNSLIGLMHVDEAEYKRLNKNTQPGLFSSPLEYPQIIAARLRNLEKYRHAANLGIQDLQGLRKTLERDRESALQVLNPMLLEEFGKLGVKFERATWDPMQNKEGKTVKRKLELKDIKDLEPFHWGFEFAEVMERVERRGFDAIITNPPWDILKPNDKEFLMSEGEKEVSINKMSIKELEVLKIERLKDPIKRREYEDYLSSFPHQSAYFRSEEQKQFKWQSSKVNGKRTGTDINLYKLFLEQCYNLLCDGGECGIVIPSGIYTDLGAKGLREMLFEKTKLTGLFGFENRREIFEGVHRSFKFVVLSFEKDGHTRKFPAAFMRFNVSDLKDFPDQTGLTLEVDLVKRLSPDSMSIMEFQTEADVKIAEKIHKFPKLGKWINGKPLQFSREFMSSDDHESFNSNLDGLVVYEGKMFEQFDSYFEKPKWWMSEKELKKTHFYERGDWKHYRFAIRRVASNTNERTLIASILPKRVVVVHSVFVNVTRILPEQDSLFLVANLNSFVADYTIRQQVTSNVTQFFIQQLSIPRLTSSNPQFYPIVARAARLICTTPEFDDLARSAGLRGHEDGATIPAERAKLRAELDGLIAHLYGLSEEEFAHILNTFPLVPEGVRLAARNAYRDVQRGLIK